MNLHGLSDSVAGVIESPAQCRQCGATTRLGNGLCLSCTLREGLEGDREESRESFEAILAEDEVRDTHWRVGNYEILEEIGRGGMGVIYRARQRHSRRIVALKRLVSYHADSRETLERFRREAEAAASLDHPNILPIFEVGQGEDGLPFFSMKYATGGSLQKAGPALRNELRECVRLMAKVAHAVQYAHEHGVLHRDLKPGNILLDGQGEPFVTDFGLAKWLDTSTDLTRTLAIFGTPGYIAPEQAKGPAANLTPTADVYSLGAILFDLFTGRPPFLGEHALAVIQQASEKPAPKLRLVAPTLDRDLETICGRCLEREPQARYRSAGDLAVDLERWLEGRPIIARRVSPPARTWRWAKRNPKLAAATAAAFCSAAAATFLFFSHNGLVPQAELDSRLPPEKSIAVLPFENLSRNPDNAYFAEGIQDEILTRLSKIADLKVISRTSTQHYKSAPTNLPEIARQLGVAHILEGSVQKSGDAVRVNVQLIKAASDSHLWADTFDRKLTDTFSVESEVAKSIADQLGAKLTGQEEQVIAGKATDNPEAYDAYLRGLAYSLKPANTTANSLGAQKYLREAVRLDPKFARAWALLSSVDSVGYLTKTLQPTVALREEARQAAETALSLQPNLGEAVLAKGYYYYGCLKDYDTAIRYFEQARQILPNDSRIPESLAYVTRRRGQWERSETYFNEAERLDPRNANLLTQHAVSLMRLRRLPQALRKLDEVLNITPDDVRTVAFKAGIAQAQGDLPLAAALLAPLHPNADDAGTLETQVYQAILERRPAAIIPRLEEILEKPDPQLGYFNSDLRFWLGWAQDLAGDHVAAQKSWRQARSELELFLKDQPDNFNVLTDLALTNMGLGDKAAALALAERAIAANPLEKDAVSGPSPIETLARVAARMGEPDRAIAALQKLLSIPAITDTAAPFTPALLRLDPMFDPLRNDPRFEKMLVNAEETIAWQSGATPAPAKSIAVLPFENLSEEKANEYFASGIQDEILTRLAAVRDLKVISRTSTAKYKSKPDNLKKVAQELGVSTILEGSVQRAGDKVRVNVQLIKAASDSHLWAETFDRKLTDIFSVESEVAKAIADRLQAKLTGAEEQVLDAKPTENAEAYDAYLRGLAYSQKTANTTANTLSAQKYLKEAVRLDPKFALGWALLSYVDAVGYRTEFLQPTVALREEVRQAAETALTLQPNLGEAVLAKGFYHYACLRDYETALRYFEEARPLLPNSSRIPELLAYVTRRQGQWDRSESYFNEAERLDPRNVSLLTQHALSYKDRRLFPEALRKLEQILNITPDDVDTIIEKAVIAQAEGDLPRASAILAPLHLQANNPNALETQIYQAILERRPVPIIARLKDILAKPDPALGSTNGELRFWLGWTQEVSGDHFAARESWAEARRELESFLKEQPEDPILLGNLALTDAGLGDQAAAFARTEHAMAALPIERDAVSGPRSLEILARVAAQLGEADRALAALQKLMATAYSGPLGPSAPLTPELLRLDPMFDPLRDDPRFQKLTSPAGIPKDFGTPAEIPEKSIAVLPFENLSRDPDNAFFTDGVQDEILTDLARVADLKVISRTSVMQYKTGAKRNLRQIGNELGVAHVLEGSVQRAGNRVRVNAQLIDARTDAHLWAQTYDRDLADVFAIQSEIAKTIADQLRTKLSPSEKSAIEQPPTTDITAFNLYSHAKNLFLTAFAGLNARADLLQAADLLKQAVARDPLFFQAYCQLAFTEINIYGILDPSSEYLAQAEAALQSAARLRPYAGETHLARARNLYWGYLDYDGALRELEIARQSLPGEDWIFSLKGYIERRQGRWEESIRDLERATELDPRNVLTLQQLAITYEQLRRYAEEKSTFERILAFEPNDPGTKSLHAFVEVDSNADTRPLHEVIDSIRDKNPAALPSVADTWLLCAFAERDPAAARKALNALGENPASLGPIADVRFNRPFMEGIIARMERDDAKVRSAFTAARAEQEKTVQAQPNYGPALCVLGLIDAGLGRKEEALREGRRAVELCPIEKDALRGVAMVKYLAMIAAWAGEKDLACEQLTIAIPRPGNLSYGQLKLMPFWDQLRGDARFEKIVEEAKEPVAGGLVATTVPAKSIAVLPFENRSHDPDNAYFADGVQDEILTRLSKIADLKVISRTSTQHYKSAPTNLPEIAKQLGVAHILEGSVQKSGDTVRVNVQLIRAANDTHVWADSFDRKLTNIFSVESEVAKTIADQLGAKLTGHEAQVIAAKPTDNPEAYDAYLKGRYFWNKRTGGDIRKSIDHFNQAIAADPNYALAYAGLAQAWMTLPAYDGGAPTKCTPQAKAFAVKALSLNEDLSDAVAVLGAVKAEYDFDFPGARTQYERAIQLDPNDATAHHWFAADVLASAGDHARELAEMKRALELDPLSLVINTNLGHAYLHNGRLDDAIAQFQKTIEMDPHFYFAQSSYGVALEVQGKLPEATVQYEKAAAMSDDPVALGMLGHAYGIAGRKDEARQIFDKLLQLRDQKYTAAYSLAIAALGLRDRNEVLNWLEKGYRERDGNNLNQIRIDPLLASLRGDPRFEALAENIVPAREFGASSK